MKRITYIILPLLFLAACAGESTDESVENNTESNTELQEEAPSEDALSEEVSEELEGLSLNVGEKWKVDSSTATGMAEIQEMLNAFDGEDSETLGKNLHKSLKEIIKNCSMTGEDHNQYHILLKAMKKEAKQLKKGKSTDPSKMLRFMDAYEAHFEKG